MRINQQVHNIMHFVVIKNIIFKTNSYPPNNVRKKKKKKKMNCIGYEWTVVNLINYAYNTHTSTPRT